MNLVINQNTLRKIDLIIYQLEIQKQVKYSRNLGILHF
nr:MAG TPA: hypothetical protein [Caudoviricetes sp.]